MLQSHATEVTVHEAESYGLVDGLRQTIVVRLVISPIGWSNYSNDGLEMILAEDVKETSNLKQKGRVKFLSHMPRNLER